jgi:phospholipid/cholesterol/gamma-HCH transport system substrate-binding protein
MRSASRRRDPRRRTLPAALAGALVLAALGYAALTAGNGLPLKSYYYLNARFRNAAELDPYSEVRIAGELVGQVLSSSFSHGAADVRLQLDPSIGRLRSDTTARIRLAGLLGAKFVQLSPGKHGRPLPPGATIPIAQTSTSVDVFDVLATFDAKRRADLRAVLGGLGEGFLGRGTQLNGALEQAPAVVGDLGTVADAVNARVGAAQRLVPGTEALTAALDPVRSELASGWQPEAQALAPLRDRRSSVQTTLTEAPTTLTVLRTGLAETDPLLAQTAGLSRELIALTGPAPAALHSATAMLHAAPRPLRQTGPLVSALRRATPPTLQLLIRTWPLAAPIAEGLASGIPPLTQLGRYGCDFTRWARDWSSIFSLGSAPMTTSGPLGLARVGLSANSSPLQGNTPGAIPTRFYEEPCTADEDRLP